MSPPPPFLHHAVESFFRSYGALNNKPCQVECLWFNKRVLCVKFCKQLVAQSNSLTAKVNYKLLHWKAVSLLWGTLCWTVIFLLRNFHWAYNPWRKTMWRWDLLSRVPRFEPCGYHSAFAKYLCIFNCFYSVMPLSSNHIKTCRYQECTQSWRVHTRWRTASPCRVTHHLGMRAWAMLTAMHTLSPSHMLKKVHS